MRRCALSRSCCALASSRKASPGKSKVLKLAPVPNEMNRLSETDEADRLAARILAGGR